MQIGVDACCWGNKRGFGRFTRELLDALLSTDRSNEYLLFVDSEAGELEDFPAGAKSIVVSTKFSQLKSASADGRRSIGDIWAMSREVLKHKVDVFFFPTVYSYFPIFNRTKILLTLHDVIADHHPDLIFPNSRSKIFWKLKQNLAIRQADLLATVSEYSKKEIINYFNIPEAGIRIISEAARPVFRVLSRGTEYESTLSRYGIGPDETFLLYVGGISPHKNLTVLIDTLDRIVNSEPSNSIRLFLVGDYKDDPFFSAYPALKEQIASYGLNERVTFTGHIPDDDLVYLYNAATLLVFPSLEEGFGLPAIEAMACGTPVVASNTGSLPEVLGSAGRFFNPLDVDEIVCVVREVIADASLRDKMKNAGLERSQAFRWKLAAEDTMKIFKELAAR